MKKMKKLLSLVLALCMVVSVFATFEITSFADTETQLECSPSNITAYKDCSPSITLTLTAKAFNQGSSYRVYTKLRIYIENDSTNAKVVEETIIQEGTEAHGEDLSKSYTVNTSGWAVGTYSVYLDVLYCGSWINIFGGRDYDGQRWHGYEDVGTINVVSGHNFTSKTKTSTYLKSAATCTKAAVYYYKCSRCSTSSKNNGNKTYTYGSSLGHDYTSQTKTSTYLKTAATCTADATYYYKCSRCSASSQGDTDTWYTDTGSATGHTPGDWVVATPASCTVNGLREKRCTVCSTLLDSEAIPATGHTAGERAVETVEGAEKYVTRCTVCDAIISIDDIDSADYSAVNAAIAAANALVATEYYDLSAVTAAVAAVETGLNAEHQAEVDAMAAAINDAISSLFTIPSRLKVVNATATIDGTTITITPAENADTVTVYPSLKDGTALTYTNLTGAAKLSRNGSLYAKNYASAQMTINGTVYTVIIDMPEAEVIEVALIDNIKVDFATAEIDGTTITLTPNTGAEYVSFYCSLKDGTPVTFSELTGAAKTSSNGTLTARYYGTATATIGEDEYTIILDMPEKVEAVKTVAELIKTANADVTIDGTTITLAPVAEGKEVCFYPTLTDGSIVDFSERTGGARISSNGTLYAKKAGTAAVTINATDYTIVFDIPAEIKTVDEIIKVANATVEVEGTTITLTAINPSTQISLYPTTKDGKTATFTERVGAKVSKNGTCYAKTNASCTMTIDETAYTVNFVFA